MFFLLYVFLYLLPVVPVARRLAWSMSRASTVTRQLPERNVTLQAVSENYVYINDKIMTRSELCQNCGGDLKMHPGGQYRTLGTHSREYLACREYEKWDGETDHWDARVEFISKQAMIVPAFLLSTLLWWLIVPGYGITQGYKALGVDWNNFAVPAPGVETPAEKTARIDREHRAEIEARDARIKLLEADAAKPIEQLMLESSKT